MPSLFVVRGRDQGKHFQLLQPVSRIGREASSDIQLIDSEASRAHAEIRLEGDGKCELLDLGSSNGTRVNGERIVRKPLLSGDRIEIGATLLIFTGTGQPSALDAAHGIDIVLKSQEGDGSRIVSSLSQSGSDSKVLKGKRGHLRVGSLARSDVSDRHRRGTNRRLERGPRPRAASRL